MTTKTQKAAAVTAPVTDAAPADTAPQTDVRSEAEDAPAETAASAVAVVWLFKGHPEREVNLVYTLDSREAGRAFKIGRAREASADEIAAGHAL